MNQSLVRLLMVVAGCLAFGYGLDSPFAASGLFLALYAVREL